MNVEEHSLYIVTIIGEYYATVHLLDYMYMIMKLEPTSADKYIATPPNDYHRLMINIHYGCITGTTLNIIIDSIFTKYTSVYYKKIL